MRILDRQRYQSFFKAYIICFVALVGLVVVIDAFANLDEFMQVASGSKLLSNIGRYYLVRLSAYFDRLSGVIAMMAAVFATTWMQRNNELIAMLAAGVGTKRVIRPILVGAVLVNGLAVVNQEWIIPQVADELAKPPDDFAGRVVQSFRSRVDTNGIVFTGGKEGEPVTQSIVGFYAALPEELVGTPGKIDAAEARYIPESATRSPLRGGWLLRKAELTPAETELDPGWIEKVAPEQLPDLPRTLKGLTDLGGDTYFLRSNVTFGSLARTQRDWFRYASTPELIRSMSDPSNAPERTEIAVFLHSRLLRPLIGLALLFVTLPQVLGRNDRNMFINLGLSLGTTAIFYLVLNVTDYLGASGMLGPELAAWSPLIGFGTVAAMRWDTIKT